MRTEMILRKLERSDRQTCFGTFIEEDTRQQDKQLIESYLSLMSIPETSCHAETGKGSTWTNVCLHFASSEWHEKGNLSSALLPDTVPVAATALGSATEIVLHLHGGAGPQQQRDHLDVALLRCQVQRRQASAGRGGHEARPTGSRRERTRLGKLASCASCASLKSLSPTQTSHAI